MLRIGLGFGLNRGGVLPSTPPPSPDFIIKVKTDNAGTSEDNQFTLPTTTGTYDYTIDWGDGVVEDITSDASQTHTYPSAGEYVITISGTFPRIFFSNGGDRLKLIETINFGDVGWTSMANAFWGCSNMDISENANGVFGAISFSSAWRSCSSLTSFPALDLSGGTNFSSAWRSCSSLTSFPALDLSGGTNFTFTWFGCAAMETFNTTLLGSGSIRSAWQNCSSLTSFPSVTFSGALDSNAQNAWQDCSSLTSFPAIDLSGATTFLNTWRGCTSMTSFPAIDLSGGTNFGSAWNGCTSMTSFPAIDLSGGTNFGSAWRSCGVLTSFATRNFYNMTNGQDAFRDTTLPTSDWSDILITQRANNNNNDVTFHGGNSKYNPAGGIARAELTDDVADGGQNWSITDGGAE